jgi:hypothetical protein
LVKETGGVGVSWRNEPVLQGYELPEASHPSASEAARYTKALVPIVYREIERNSLNLSLKRFSGHSRDMG